MKKLLLAVSLAFAASSAQAEVMGALGGLFVDSGDNSCINGSCSITANNTLQLNRSITPTPGDDGWGSIGNPTVGSLAGGSYTSGTYGTLYSVNSSVIEFTFLGKVAAFNNFSEGGLSGNEGSWVGGARWDDSTIGTKASVVAGAGQRVQFGFQSSNILELPGLIRNGETNTSTYGIMFLDASVWNNNNPTKEQFDFLIGYNDPSDGNADYDDYVLGVKSVRAVPVPAALPLMASALGMFGIARRRKTLA